MFSFEKEFLDTELEKRISKKIQQELNADLFYIICFTDLKPGKLDADAFIEYLKNASEEIHKRKDQKFSVLLKFPESQPAVEVLIVNRKKPLKKPPESSCKNWALTLFIIKSSMEIARDINHSFHHFAPTGYNLKKRLENLLGHAADQMCSNAPNVVILYTREVVLGKLDEVYANCESLFMEKGYFIIDAVAINVEDRTHKLKRRLFERHGSKLPVRIDYLL